MDNQLLTPLELKIMHIMWRLKKAFVKEMLEEWPEKPKPAYNTVSTTVRILQRKGFVGHKAFGRTHQYYPTLSKYAYQKQHIRNVVKHVFAGSATHLVSALVDNEHLSNDELDAIQAMINDKDNI